MDTILHHHILSLYNQDLLLIPQKAIFWKNKNILIVSDLHFGKAGHFRKSGIAVPSNVHEADFQTLDLLIAVYQPETLIFLGDLFHSKINNQWRDLNDWFQKHNNLRIHLVKGNHDILPERLYEFKNLKVHKEALALYPFIFTHKPMDEVPEEGFYNLSGHIHPAVTLKGKAKQSVTLPCFYFGKSNGLLPAFGRFTGNSLLNIHQEDQVYVVTGKSVIATQNLVSTFNYK